MRITALALGFLWAGSASAGKVFGDGKLPKGLLGAQHMFGELTLSGASSVHSEQRIWVAKNKGNETVVTENPGGKGARQHVYTFDQRGKLQTIVVKGQSKTSDQVYTGKGLKAYLESVGAKDRPSSVSVYQPITGDDTNGALSTMKQMAETKNRTVVSVVGSTRLVAFPGGGGSQFKLPTNPFTSSQYERELRQERKEEIAKAEKRIAKLLSKPARTGETLQKAIDRGRAKDEYGDRSMWAVEHLEHPAEIREYTKYLLSISGKVGAKNIREWAKGELVADGTTKYWLAAVTALSRR